MDAGERNCMLFECVYTSPEREKSQAIFHSAKCHTQIVTSNRTKVRRLGVQCSTNFVDF